jgi:hypothetical protein
MAVLEQQVGLVVEIVQGNRLLLRLGVQAAGGKIERLVVQRHRVDMFVVHG